MSEITTKHRSPTLPSRDSQSAAADLVRARLDTLYGVYRQLGSSSPDVSSRGSHLIANFWQRHSNHPSPHLAWNSYYEELSVADKNHLWKEYHLRSGPLSGVAWDPLKMTLEKMDDISAAASSKRPSDLRRRSPKSVSSASAPMTRRHRFFLSHIKPILSAGLIVSILWFVFYNPLVVAQVKLYISPGSTLSSPAIIDPQVSVEPAPRVIIPKINVDVPTVYGVISFDESAIQEALEFGVVHYGTTAVPGQAGNAVYIGHSSNNLFNAGQYKFAFLQLNKLEIGDTFYLHYETIRYVYRVTAKVKVMPDDFTYIQPTEAPSATLITCDPPGTNWKRLVIQGQQISPDPTAATVAEIASIEVGEDAIVPGNSPSLWSRFWNALF